MPRILHVRHQIRGAGKLEFACLLNPLSSMESKFINAFTKSRQFQSLCNISGKSVEGGKPQRNLLVEGPPLVGYKTRLTTRTKTESMPSLYHRLPTNNLTESLQILPAVAHADGSSVGLNCPSCKNRQYVHVVIGNCQPSTLFNVSNQTRKLIDARGMP